MTPEERRKAMEERLAQMTPEQRAAFEERRAARQRGEGGDQPGGGQFGGGRGGFGGGQPGGGRGGAGGQRGAQNNAGNAGNAGGTQPSRNANQGRVASAPSMTTGATTIDSLFGPLPTIETRGQAWVFENKQLKQIRLRLGVSDSTYTEILQSDPELKEGTEVVTSVIIEQPQAAAPGAGNANNPLMGQPQRGRPGGPGGGQGGGGRGGR